MKRIIFECTNYYTKLNISVQPEQNVNYPPKNVKLPPGCNYPRLRTAVLRVSKNSARGFFNPFVAWCCSARPIRARKSIYCSCFSEKKSVYCSWFSELFWSHS